jgi:hypothetical protein
VPLGRSARAKRQGLERVLSLRWDAVRARARSHRSSQMYGSRPFACTKDLRQAWSSSHLRARHTV